MERYLTDLEKMRTQNGAPIQYFLPTEQGEVNLNAWIGKEVSLFFGGVIHCVGCGKRIQKPMAQGFCYDCFMQSPDNSPCILHPELCKGHLAEGRDVAWEFTHHVQPHTVYFALTTAVKVGVTRNTQIPTRWIDQGAGAAMVFAQVPYRKLAGEIEVALKAHFTDKTNWQHLVTGQPQVNEDIEEVRKAALGWLPAHLQSYVTSQAVLQSLDYPVQSYPEKAKSLNLLSQAEFSGTLTGIRGQYLLFKEGLVFNVRNHSGFRVQWECK